MRRRNKPRVAWLPPTTSNIIGGLGVNESTVYRSFNLDLAPGSTLGSTVAGEVSVVADGGENLTDAALSLADIVNQGYRLRRIVGKIFATQIQEGVTGEDTHAALQILTCGFIIRTADPQTGVSLAAFSGQVRQFGPGQLENTTDPWIWRRSWIIGNPSAFIPGTTPLGDVPSANYGPGGPCSGNLDGPHIDQKTARIIGPEQRLFFGAELTLIQNNLGIAGQAAPLEETSTVNIVLDLRILGSMRTTTGNRRNASR